MKFVEFLTEAEQQSDYKKKISVEDAIILAKNNPNTEKLIFRGMKDSGDYLLIEGDKGGRQSAHTKNYYTMLLDQQLKDSKYPMRSKSIICTTNRRQAKDYGELYVIIPLKGTKIATTNHGDIWNMRFNALNCKDHMVDFNQHYIDTEISDKSYDKFLKGLKSLVETDLKYFDYDSDVKYAAKELKKVFQNEMTVEKDLTTLYGSIIDQFSLHDDSSDLPTNCECWIGGKCLAVKFDAYMDNIVDVI